VCHKELFANDSFMAINMAVLDDEHQTTLSLPGVIFF
jgi:hypothetical protein